MTVLYNLTADGSVLRTSDNALIPNDPDNRDWQGYQEWLAAGNSAAPYAAPAPIPSLQFDAAINAGVDVIWSASTSLNATYAIDQTTQFNISAEMISILTNGVFGTGTTIRNWPDQSKQYHSINILQFKQLATAIAQYLNALYATLALLEAEQPAQWPSNQIVING